MNTRNLALDAARFGAVFGVVAIHCAPRTDAAALVGDFFQNFCVPLFLLVSLGLFFRETGPRGAASGAIARRLGRIVGPYIVWTGIYVAARCAKVAMQQGSLREEFTPAIIVHVIGSGGGAVHLYFLPLLAVALALAWLLAPGLRRLPHGMLAVLVALGGLALCFPPDLGEAISRATPLGQLGLRYLDSVIWVLPIVVAAAAIMRWFEPAKPQPAVGWSLLLAAVAINLLLVAYPVPAFWRLHSLLIAALVLVACSHLRNLADALPPRAAPVLNTFFGIFLCHHLLIEAVEWIDGRTGVGITKPYSVAALLAVTVGVLAASVVFTLAIKRWRPAARVLLGQ